MNREDGQKKKPLALEDEYLLLQCAKPVFGKSVRQSRKTESGPLNK